ncbi:MAG: glycosyltransferase [Collinsella sp.]
MTGNPVRRSVIEGDRARGRKTLGVPEDDASARLWWFARCPASQRGALPLKSELLTRKNLYILHSTGADGFEETERALAPDARGGEALPCPALHRQHGRYAGRGQIWCSRSGASSVAEIAALAVPSVLVPYPARTADHRPQCPLPGRCWCRRALRRCRYRCPCLCRRAAARCR